MTTRNALPVLLSVNAGYVDTAGFLALHGLFTAHVTGNFVTLGAALVMPLAGKLTDRFGGGRVAVVGISILTLSSLPLAFIGADNANATTEVTDAIADADVVLVAPSNPVVSVGAILAIPGIRAALRSTGAPVVGYSPIIGGKPLRGMADECLKVIGVPSTAEAVGGYYGARAGTGILDCWLIHDGDRAEIDGLAVRSIPLLMTDPKATAEMVTAGLELAGVAA